MQRAATPVPAAPGAVKPVTPFAWQGWRLDLPAGWDPVKLEGDFDKGSALFADLRRPRLGVRWETVRGKKIDPLASTSRTMAEEVGRLAAGEAEASAMSDRGAWAASLLYVDPEPPGRDVWVGHSNASGRAVQVVCHSRGERTPLKSLLSGLRDQAGDGPSQWAVFDLSCVVPAGLSLRSHRLNAGDLGLTFGGRGREVSVRQVAVAGLALRRMPLEGWLAEHQRPRGKFYRCQKESKPVTVWAGGRELSGVSNRATRRRRFFWMQTTPSERTAYALHDPERDRLVFVEATRPDLLEEVSRTVGCLGREAARERVHAADGVGGKSVISLG